MSEIAIETTYDLATVPGVEMVECMKAPIVTNVDLIIKHVSEKLSITIEEIKGKSRLRHIVEARQMCMYLVKERLNYSLTGTANIFKKHHSTVIHALTTIDDLCESDKTFKEKFYKIYFSL